jgi:hypothetical protein
LIFSCIYLSLVQRAVENGECGALYGESAIEWPWEYRTASPANCPAYIEVG